MTHLPTWTAGDEPATLSVPPLSVDCHHHIYDNRFPYDPETSLRPADATVAQYRILQKRLGIFRSVVVQPSSYGTDNRCLVDALKQFGDNARGVAVIDSRTPDADIRAMHDAGVRGIRFNLSRPAGANIDQLEALARRIEPLGWHVQVHTLGAAYVQLEKYLAALPVPVVIDHLGRVPQPAGLSHEVFAVLRRLVDKGKTWMKLSGAYHDSLDGAPSYADTGRMVTEWLTSAPERVVWGTDWPHPAAMVGEKPMPNDARLLDLLGEWAPNSALIRKVLVDNPIALYGFSSGSQER
ncbi:amidohydrolase family protein [Paraburkholderia sp. Ac-20342]|uniref:amidohydrolase family protein n=1 Tax=Paraburkholderia sp. Ac-20342 TaxID=2703889 RepID=UPI00197DE7A9|nr:amidohydrolase family protein [Paraburkholderia sp. Ac-20342]MBN3847800.1 amidohydrolase family protein [Paraburkholderia sp. Ac-20342]